MSVEHDSLERLIPAEIEDGEHTGRETLELHLERYEFAARQAQPGRLLDMACGVGYGTRLITDRTDSVTSGLGIDLSSEAIDYALAHYANERTSYQQSDAMRFEDGAGFETIVSLETIEHLPDPESFLDRLVILLRPGGVLIASVPVTPSVDFNPHHLHDFTRASFRRMLKSRGLVEIDRHEQVQSVNPLAVARRTETRMKTMRPNVTAYYLAHPGAFFRRVFATLRYGFTNRYLTLACRKPEGTS